MEPRGTSERSTMRLLAWNILHGGNSRRLPHIALELVAHRPDIAVISEFRPTLGGQILAILADRGLVHTAEATAATGRNRTIICSRWPVAAIEVETAAMPACLERRVVCRRIETGNESLALTGSHLPDDWTPSAALHGWSWLVSHSLALREHHHVILGDLNGSRDRGQPGGAPAHVAHAMGRLATAGYADAFDANGLAGEAVSGPETTWKSHWGHELRLDHAIVSASLSGRIASAKYAHLPRKEGVSDHSVVVVEIARAGSPIPGAEQKYGKNHERTVVEPMCRPCQTASGAIESRGSRRESKLFME